VEGGKFVRPHPSLLQRRRGKTLLIVITICRRRKILHDLIPAFSRG
jgi:hypothetical protein